MIKEISEGLSLKKGEDGHWLNFESHGVHGSLNLESIVNNTGIIQAGVLGWARDQFESTSTELKPKIELESIKGEWKELVIHNLPKDIMTGNYEVEYLADDTWEEDLNWEEDLRGVVLDLLKSGRYRNRYRERTPDHEKIINNWYYDKNTRVWCRVIGYRNGIYSIYHHKHMQNENYNTVSKKTADWFIGKQSSKTPPMENKSNG